MPPLIVWASFFISFLPLSVLSISTGPVISTNFQDPSLIHVDGIWYAFAGANGNPEGINVQMATSPDFSSWTLAEGHEALPNLGSWATFPGHLWSPDVNQLPDGSFVMYYSASTRARPHQHCIGVATSKNVAGPYIPLDTTLACDHSKGGAIDADGFIDIASGDLGRYVVYKVDGNSIGHGGACKNTRKPIVPTPIMLQRVSLQDGHTKIGKPVKLLDNTPADGPNIEAPALVYDISTKLYFLMYNAGCFKDPQYRIEYATSESIEGPYTRSSSPLLVTGDTAARVHSPGGIDFNANGTRMIFQGDLNMDWTEEKHGKRDRGMYAAGIEFNKNSARVVRLY